MKKKYQINDRMPITAVVDEVSKVMMISLQVYSKKNLTTVPLKSDFIASMSRSRSG